MKFYRPVHMRTKILLSFMLFMVIALGIQTFLFYRSSSLIIYDQSKKISITSMESLQNDLYTFNKSIENSLIKIYNLSDFMRDFSDPGSLQELSNEYSQVSYDIAHSAFIPSQYLTTLYVYDANDILISTYRHAQTPVYSYPEDIYDQKYNSNLDLIKNYLASDNRVMLITSVYNENRKTTLIRYVLKIYRNRTESVGYLVCDVDPKPFELMVEKYRFDKNQIIWMQPLGGQVAVVEGEAADNPTYKKISQLIASGTPEDAKTLNENNLVFQTVQERKYDFSAYSLLPQSILELNQLLLLKNISIIATSIIAMSFLLFLIISQLLTRPLTYIVSTMKRIKQGETTLRLKSMGKDEIGLLGDEFNAMLDETERLIKNEYASQLSIRDAKYKALQAQINPHFLYNTLDTMSGIADSYNCTAVGTLSRALSNVFRYSLEFHSPFTRLLNEIVHIKNYVYIMNVRSNRSIELVINIDNNLLNCTVLRLSIQPIVENAINHGLKNKRGSKQITIDAARENHDLLLWVEDNGVGMDAAPVNEQMERSEEDALSKKTSIGLDNINARVKLLYGKEYGLKIDSMIGVGTRVTLRIPYIVEEAT